MATKKKPANILSPRTATVSYSLGGLIIEIKDVPAVDSGLVSQAIMNTVRKLAAIYPELTEGLEAAVHSHPLEQPEEEDDVEFVLPPQARARRRIGF